MTQDYAKKTRQSPTKRNEVPGWVWFLSGLVLGVFGSFLVYVWRDLPLDVEVDAIASKPSADAVMPKIEDMKWDFYDIFPRSEVPIVEEYAPDGRKVKVPGPVAYLVQAGSFRNASDADQLRAELILLGMTVFTREIDKDGVKWHRVLVGPLNSDTELSRTRRALAEANIQSIALRVTP